MKRRTTLKDIAKAADVHVSTASRALDPKSRHLIGPSVLQRILKISQELGYRHNAAAVALRTARSNIIGLVVPDLTNPIFPPIIRGVEDSLAKYGLHALIGNTDGDLAREEVLVGNLQERGVDGFLLASVGLQDKTVSKLLSEQVPLVTVNRRVGDESVSSVVADEADGIKRALTHLASLGHRDIAEIAGPQHLSTGADRHAAFLLHRKALGLPEHAELVVFARNYVEAEGERCVEELLVKSQRFTAIVCANDRLAIGAIAGLSRRGIECPADISVTGFNDMPMVDRLKPPLTTVRIEQYKIGFQAGDLLARTINGEETKGVHIVLPVDLVIRGSTRPITPSGE